ncbi:hypothetical protein [Rubellimicrobium roseum]|uniref:Uncharacterized protein n=1 Tax=Rubellimicrobium roseum TaxID=687525 RepID=A0A5C4NAA9_9RHOB|nr:hypothetical protein [Rubellimicrobium roseum]TNC65151.1 hypothetical protein FHG71_17735 [Rubellimicrobium roseum]
MSDFGGLPRARLDLAWPAGERLVQQWIGVPANRAEPPRSSPDLPTLPTASGKPQVIFAEYRPRLSGPELLAKHKGLPRMLRPVLPTRPVRQNTHHRRLTMAWWPMVAVAAMLLSAGTPLL